MTDRQTDGIRRTVLKKLNALKKTKLTEGILDPDILTLLHDTTLQLNREILLLINDRGIVEDVCVGDATSARFPARTTSGGPGLSRLRAIHTHPSGSPVLSEEDLSSARQERLQAMIAIGVKAGTSDRFGIALPLCTADGLSYRLSILPDLKTLNEVPLSACVHRVNRDLRKTMDQFYHTEGERERALLLGVAPTSRTEAIAIDDSMNELARLATTAGCTVVGQTVQNRLQPDALTYLGKGKILETVRTVQNLNANLIITNDELVSSQIATIETLTGVKTIDRTTVILDIFARHATTREGKLQVELAQQRYRLSHLKGLGLVLSRTGGGIGTRGPGEKQLETDRRHIRRQVDELRRQLNQTVKTNTLSAKRRSKNHIRTVSLVGYTNSGKSTLFNTLTESDVAMKDGLFVTLDATVRKIRPQYGRYLLSDTVGFIEKLPHDLINAFQTTLSEVQSADLLLHVIDAANPNAARHIDVVQQVTRDIGAQGVDCLLVYNKVDKLLPSAADGLRLRAKRTGAFVISARTGDGLPELMAAVSDHLNGQTQIYTYLIPYADSKVLARLHDDADIINTAYTDAGTRVSVRSGRDFPTHLYLSYQEDPHET